MVWFPTYADEISCRVRRRRSPTGRSTGCTPIMGLPLPPCGIKHTQYITVYYCFREMSSTDPGRSLFFDEFFQKRKKNDHFRHSQYDAEPPDFVVICFISSEVHKKWCLHSFRRCAGRTHAGYRVRDSKFLLEISDKCRYNRGEVV